MKCDCQIHESLVPRLHGGSSPKTHLVLEAMIINHTNTRNIPHLLTHNELRIHAFASFLSACETAGLATSKLYSPHVPTLAVSNTPLAELHNADATGCCMIWVHADFASFTRKRTQPGESQCEQHYY
jgi:hypothetical protein